MYICIAGKNKCAVNALKLIIKNKIKKSNILVLPNNSDKGKDTWQPSLKRFAKKNGIRIVKQTQLYSVRNLILFSLEYEKIIDLNKFRSKSLYNLHFSLLPKYRGCHTNFLQIYNGEKYSGVTLHQMDKGIDTGPIIDQIKFKIKINDTAYDNYKKLMFVAVNLFKKNFTKIINKKYVLKKQILSKGNYFSRKSVNYNKIISVKFKKSSLKTHNKIRSLIFPAYQYPLVNEVRVSKSIYKNKKIYLTAATDYKSKY